MLNRDIATGTERVDVDELELKGFSRSIAELEWLLLILVLLYFVSPSAEISDRSGVIISMLIYAVWVFAFRYCNFYHRETRLKLAIETWLMIVFISWILWNAGGVDSPLLNLYLLVIITSSLTLGKVVTLLEFILITCIYVFLAYPEIAVGDMSAISLSEMMSRFAPFLLVGYLTTMLSADLQYSRQLYQQLSERDDMTGLLNKRAFRRALEAEFKLASRYGREFSIMMIDADNLKQVNDEHGHEAGDSLILMMTEQLRQSVRETDILARYGGDEFVVLLTDTAGQPAKELGSRILNKIRNTSFDFHGKEIRSTVSIGIATYPTNGLAVTDVMQKADRALYLSKEAGKSTVTQYIEAEEEELLRA